MEFEIVLLVGGVLIAAVGMAMYFALRNREYTHTLRVNGVVTRAEEKPITVIDKHGKEVEGINHLTFFRYELENGEPYETARYTTKRYVPGQMIELKCNPEDRKNVVEAVTEGNDPKKIYTLLMCLGVVVMVIGVLLMEMK